MAIRNVTRFSVLLLWIFFGISLAVAQEQLPSSKGASSPFYPLLKNALIVTDSNKDEQLSISDVDMRKSGLSSALVVATAQTLTPGTCTTEIDGATVQPVTDVEQIRNYVDKQGYLRSTVDGWHLASVHIDANAKLCVDMLDKNTRVIFADQLVTIQSADRLPRYVRARKSL